MFPGCPRYRCGHSEQAAVRFAGALPPERQPGVTPQERCDEEGRTQTHKTQRPPRPSARKRQCRRGMTIRSQCPKAANVPGCPQYQCGHSDQAASRSAGALPPERQPGVTPQERCDERKNQNPQNSAHPAPQREKKAMPSRHDDAFAVPASRECSRGALSINAGIQIKRHLDQLVHCRRSGNRASHRRSGVTRGKPAKLSVPRAPAREKKAMPASQ